MKKQTMVTRGTKILQGSQPNTKKNRAKPEDNHEETKPPSPCKDIKIAMQRLRKCSQSEDSKSFIQRQGLKARCGHEAKNQLKEATVIHEPCHAET